jgi:putative transposase
VKKSLLVEAEGGPLGITVAGANVPDTQLMAVTIAAIVLERPPVEGGYEPLLALDTGYDNDRGWGVCLDAEHEPHIALIHDARPLRPTVYPARRWVVERTLAWLSLCCGMPIRWEKKRANDLGMLKLACGLLSSADTTD